MIFEWKPKHIKGESRGNIWTLNIIGRGSSKSKDPGMGAHLPGSGMGREASVGAEWRSRERHQEVRRLWFMV